jgi:hypothetical protein
MTNVNRSPATPSDEFLAHWNAPLIAGEDMALTLGLEPLSGDPDEVTVTMALTPAIRRRWPATTLRLTRFRSPCNRRSRSSETRPRATQPAAPRSSAPADD